MGGRSGRGPRGQGALVAAEREAKAAARAAKAKERMARAEQREAERAAEKAARTANTPPMCCAIREAREMVGWTQTRLADMLGVQLNQISGRWELGREPALDECRRIEEVLGLPKGYLLRAAGYVEDAVTTEDAIANDPRLTPEYRDAVLAALGSMIKSASANPRARRH